MIKVDRILLTTGGAVTAAIAALHLSFPWLLRLSALPCQAGACYQSSYRVIHILAIAILLGWAYLSTSRQTDLLSNRLGRSLLFLTSLLWGLRASIEVALVYTNNGGSAWLVVLFLSLSGLYQIPLVIHYSEAWLMQLDSSKRDRYAPQL